MQAKLLALSGLTIRRCLRSLCSSLSLVSVGITKESPLSMVSNRAGLLLSSLYLPLFLPTISPQSILCWYSNFFCAGEQQQAEWDAAMWKDIEAHSDVASGGFLFQWGDGTHLIVFRSSFLRFFSFVFFFGACWVGVCFYVCAVSPLYFLYSVSCLAKDTKTYP